MLSENTTLCDRFYSRAILVRSVRQGDPLGAFPERTRNDKSSKIVCIQTTWQKLTRSHARKLWGVVPTVLTKLFSSYSAEIRR